MHDIYIAAPLISVEDRHTTYVEWLATVCRRAGYEPYVPHLQTADPTRPADAKMVRDKNLAAVWSARLVLADLTHPSHGVGMEIQAALTGLDGFPVPVLGVRRKTSAPLSRMLTGTKIEVLDDPTEEQLKDALLKHLGRP